ncbi:phospholipid scramblase 2 isoform X2 [Bradysia coprophila]|uniref:phospholipid scramblase 2 isoform X2 n=1 Tax=Bradysia coprophila TaxID=38358 RepID=UPI00187DD90B|nr:phospholipid scramblase 2 isoform X2 [Bradysia coprophila]
MAFRPFISSKHSGSSSENRYTVRGPTNETIFAASESSKPRDRLLFGALRPFSMHLIDKTHQEALSFRRKLAFGLLCCQPQSIEIWAPPGDLLGRVKETFSLFNAEFVIEDSHGNIIYQIEGPPKLLCFCQVQELHLKVLSPDFVSQQGSITRIWNTDISSFTQNVYFADMNLDVKFKALFLGAAVLMVLLLTARFSTTFSYIFIFFLL